MKFVVDGILRISNRDGRSFATIEYMGGKSNVIIDKTIDLPSGMTGTFRGEIRTGKENKVYFIVTHAEPE